MVEEIAIVNENFFKKSGLIISKVEPELEAKAYLGFDFKLNDVGIKFRKGKITPKKPGFFVTLWQRNSQGISEPFDSNDHFELLIIAVEDTGKSGYFLFTKSFLIENKILKNNSKGGKRGFRIYNQWHEKLNLNAEKTRKIQNNYFIDLNENEEDNLKKFQELTSHIFK